MQRAVVAAQLHHAIVDVSKQAICRQGRQGAQHAAKGDIAAGFKMGRAPSRRPNAARTRSSGRVQAVPISAAASRTARVDLSVARRLWSGACSGFAAGRVDRARSVALLDCLAKRVELEAQVLGDFSSAPTGPQNCCAWA